MIEPLLAGIGLAVCAVLLLRMALPARQQRRLDERSRRAWHAVQRRSLALWHWRSRRKRATSEASAAIRRARGAPPRDDNVVRPKSGERRRKPH